MPLHLLGKKSWNVYNATNVERVKRDEAEAKAQEEAEEQRQQQEDSARRIAILRGEQPPEPTSDQVDEAIRERIHHDYEDQIIRDPSHLPRKRRRLRGEDETDADIRYARKVGDLGREVSKVLKSSNDNTALVDHTGHIQLVPQPVPEDKKGAAAPENASHDRAKDGARVHSSHAGRNPPSEDTFGSQAATETPWYSSRPTDTTKQTPETILDTVNNVNAWGRPDERRTDRELTRISSNDPLAFMRRAQSQLKQNEARKRQSTDERRAELEAMRTAAPIQEHRAHEGHDRERRSERRRSSQDRSRKARHHSTDAESGRGKRRSSAHRRSGRSDDHNSRHHDLHHRAESPSRRQRR